MPIKAVLFDMFDTLMIIQKEHAFYSPAVKNMYTYLTSNGISVTFPKFRDAYIKARDAIYEEADKTLQEPHFNVRIKNALTLLGYNTPNMNIIQGATDAFCDEFMKYVIIDEHATAALTQLHGQYQLGLVSNFAVPECVQKLLQQHNLERLFGAVVVSAAVNRRKPCPEIFQCALQKLQVTAADAVFVGDTVDADIQGPQQVGMKTVYIDRRPQKELEVTRPDQIITSLSELPKTIQKLAQNQK
jgi:HAD superfamily hydrolase (TIGR01549 family)